MNNEKFKFGLTHDEILHASRHLLIPEIGIEGQRRLKSSSVLIIGVGGLGAPAAMYLAAAGVGRIGLLDHDAVERSNLQRQVLYGASDLGKRKAASARERLLDINPSIQVASLDETFSPETAIQTVQPYDVIIDASDNFPTRYLINDVCVKTGKPDVYGAVFRFESQMSVFWSGHGPCYRCLFPSPPQPGKVPSCDEAGIFNVVPGTIGTLQAAEALKLLLGIGEPLTNRLLLYDSWNTSMEIVETSRNPVCPVCSLPREEAALIDTGSTFGDSAAGMYAGASGESFKISPGQLHKMLEEEAGLQLVDVREPHELLISALPDALNFPCGKLASAIQDLNPAMNTILLSRTGTRAARALHILQDAGFHQVRCLTGGLNAWAREVDSSMPEY